MAQVTAPVILDSTGQQIVTALQNLNNNVKPTADQIKRTSSNNQTVEAALVSLNSHIVQIEKRAKSTSSTLADGASMTVAQSNSAGLLIVKVTGQNIEYVAVHGFMYINQYAKNLGSAIYTYNYMGTAPVTIEMASNGIKITNTSGKSVVSNALLLCESNAV